MVRDARKPPPNDAGDEAWKRWFNEVVWERLNINSQIETTTLATNDELYLFSASAGALRKITLANLRGSSVFGETGSWTPVLGATVTSGTHTYATQVGRYTYIPYLNRIWADFHIDITTKDSSGTTSGNLQITGLPYASRTNAGYRAISTLRYATLDLNVAAARYSAVATITNNSTVMTLNEFGDNVTAAALTDVDFANGTILIGSISYETA